MCGNGARCAARFAVENAIAGPDLSFETRAGSHPGAGYGQRGARSAFAAR